MSWMGFINPGMLLPSNLALFGYCIEHLPSEAPIVEIGSFAGLSVNHLILLLRRARRTKPCTHKIGLDVRCAPNNEQRIAAPRLGANGPKAASCNATFWFDCEGSPH
jgi:hypothetical protein